MANSDDELDAAAEVPPEQLSDELSAEIAERWDPERILQLVARRAGKGEALDATLRSRYERRLGVDLSHVRVYTGELAKEVADAHHAHAVTIGNTGMIMMAGSADRSMATSAGQALLAHELTHVAQAQRGMWRSATDGSMDLATEEHEAEAHEAEEQELSEQQGGGQERRDPEGDHQKLVELVRARVLDMFADAGRLVLLRGGPTPRRP